MLLSQAVGVAVDKWVAVAVLGVIEVLSLVKPRAEVRQQSLLLQFQAEVLTQLP
tara:strand:- start:654 stop:815 length:162 start_codon:yes stop_codon:yes gene_type:complete